MKEKIFIASCGDLCPECPRYIATMSNDNEQLAYVANLWFRVGFRDRIVSTDEIQCTGCSKTKACSNNINSCIHLQGIDTCGECQKYPCQKIENVFSKSESFDSVCLERCTSEEYRQLQKAFFHKRQILQDIRRKRFHQNDNANQ
jgi:hypothetical protein